MKKAILLGIIILLAFTAMPSATSAFVDKVHVVVDGKPLSSGAIMKKNVTYVPFRDLFKELGLSIKYDSKTKQVTGTKSNLIVTFTVGSKTAYVNGEKKALQAAPFVSGGSVYVPLRIVGEATGSLVKYFSDVEVVLVNSPSFEGLIYDSNYGSLDISKDGKLRSDNLLVLDAFLSFSQEEVIVYEKELSTDDGIKPFVTLTPDSVVVPVE